MEEVTITLVPNTVGGENGVLLGVGGTVEIKYPDTGIWQEAQVGMILIQGVELRTGPNSHAWGLLAPEQADRPFFYKEENTHVRNLTAPTPGTIRLLLGTLWYKAKSILNRSNRHQVATENATASVLGTEVKFETSSEGDTITLIEGRVEVRPVALPEELTILNPGERLHIKGANIELEQLSEQELEALRDTLEDFEFIVDPQLKFDFESEQQAGVWIEDASGSWRVSEGMYVMTGARAGVEIYSYFVEELRDLTFEADLRKIEGDSPGAFTEYGMRFRSDGTSHNFYQFAISTDGLYSVGKMVAGVFTPLIGWTRSEALNLGHGAWNRLKAVAQGVELSFYGNGELLNRVEDSSLSSGKAGLFAKDGASSQPRDTVQFDNVTLAQADASSAGGSDDLSLVFSDSFERASLGDQWLSGAEPGNEKLIQIVDGHVETRANLNYIETEQSFGGDLRIEVDVEKTGNEDWWCFDFWIELVALEKKGAIRFDTQAGKVGINIGGLGLVCGDASQMDAGTLNRGKAILEYTAPNLQFSFINTDGEVLTAETLQVGEFDSSKIRIWLGGQADTPRSVDNVRVYSSSSAGKPPSISSIGDQLIEAGTITQAIAFTVGDAETAASNLAVTGSSSNTQLVSEAGISLGGSGANRTVTITPTTGQTGASTITIKVTDEHGLPAETSFVLTVNAVPTGTGALLFSDSFDRSSLGDQWLSGTELGYENTVRIVDGKVEVRTNFNYIETQQSFGGDLRVEVDVERAGPSSWQCFDFQVQLGAVEQRGFIRFDWAGTDAINIGAAGICGDRYSMDSGAPNKGTAILEYKSPNLQFSFLSDNGNRLITEELAVGEFESSKVRILLGAHADTPRYVDEVRVYSSGSNGETGPQSPQITGQPQSVTVTSGETVEFRVTASGTIPLSYQWKHNGRPLPGATSAILQLSSVSMVDAGEYTVVVSNAAGQVESQGAVLTVRSQPSGSSFALRRLPSGYIGRTQLTVSIEAAPPNRALAYGLEDQQPAGWTISDIDSGGAHDTVSGEIKWTFLDNNPRTLTYRVTPPAGTSGVQCFSGIGNVNGTDENPIGGDQCIELAQQHPADLEPSDWSLSLSEVLKYAAAYKRGDVWSMNPNPIPLDYVIRGLVLYKSGEQYRIDESIGSAPGWWVTDVIRLASPRFSRATVLNVGSSAISELPHEYTSGVPFMVTIRVTPAQGGVAYGVEDQPPAGWSVSAINESGEYDAVNHKVKWTFLDNQARSLSYEVTSPQDTQGSATFTGMVSFDGAVNKAIEGNRSTTTTTASPPQISITIDVSGNIVLTFDGELHSASEVTGPYAEVPGAVSPLTVNPAPMSRFYRAVRQ